MWQLKNISYFNTLENVGRYLLKIMTTLYQTKNVSHHLFFLHLDFYTQIFV